LITTDGGLVSVDTDPNVVIVDKIKSKIDNLLKQLSKNSKTVEGLQSDIRAVKEYASDLQTFLGSKAIEEEVKKEEENLMALLSNVVCKVSLISLIDFTDGC
jgi:predicted transcriptional regulator